MQKIKLIIIDTFDYEYNPSQPEYFYTEDHMDYFRYSPVHSDKLIETDFEAVLSESDILMRIVSV